MMIKALTLETVVHVERKDNFLEDTFFGLFSSVVRERLKVLRSAPDKIRLPYMRRRFEASWQVTGIWYVVSQFINVLEYVGSYVHHML
jgi:hypothetical protein